MKNALKTLTVAAALMLGCDTNVSGPGDDNDNSYEADDQCAAHSDCTMRGLCTMVDGRCEAANRDDCLGSIDCRANGYCTAWGIAGLGCHIGSDADCAQSLRCTEDGECYKGLGVSSRLLGEACVDEPQS